MKRLVLIILLALSLTGCATQSDVDNAYEAGFKAGSEHAERTAQEQYLEGVKDGREAGRREMYYDIYTGEVQINTDEPLVQTYKDLIGEKPSNAATSNKNSSSGFTNPLSDMGIDDETFDIVVQHVKDNPIEFYLYSERDLELAYESGLEDAGW